MRLFLVLPIAAFAIALAACGKGNSPQATPSASASSTPSAQATASPTATSTPSGAHLPTGEPVGPLAVYSARVGPVGPNLKLAIHAFDIGAGREWAAFTCDNGCGHAQVWNDRQVIYSTTDHSVVVRSFDSAARKLFNAPPGEDVTGLAVSPSGRLLGVTISSTDMAEGTGQIVFVDISDPAAPTVVKTVERSDPGLAGFTGYFASPEWVADDAGVFVVGAVGRDGPGAGATVFVDGTVVVHEVERHAVSPDGRFMFDTLGSPCPYVFFGPTVTVRDAVSQKVLTTYTVSGGAAAALEWAPDSSAVLMETWAHPDDGCDAVAQWSLLPVNGGPPTPWPTPACFAVSGTDRRYSKSRAIPPGQRRSPAPRTATFTARACPAGSSPSAASPSGT